tara:strand:+ start:482 stop:1186 length:705 start_codon:yes stop_codon:yes gene_type:complete
MTLKLNGSTSGSVSLDAPASTTGGADFTITLPATNGTLLTNTTTKRRVLEQFASLADGTSHVLDCGTITMQNVTAQQTLTTTWTDAIGSVVNYKPPTGTVQIIYEFSCFWRNADATAITFFAMSVDDTANVNSLLHLNSTGDYMYTNFISVINIGSGFTGGANVGQYTSWGDSTKKLSMKARDYSNSYDAQLYEAGNLPHPNWYTQGFSAGTGGSGTNPFIKPVVRITSIGLDT